MVPSCTNVYWINMYFVNRRVQDDHSMYWDALCTKQTLQSVSPYHMARPVEDFVACGVE